MRWRPAGWRLAMTAVAVGGALGCATTPATPVPRPLTAEVAAFLLDPSPLASPQVAPLLSALHRRLLAGEPPAELALELDRLAPGADDDGALHLSRAQLDFVDGRGAAAEAELAALGPATAETLQAKLLAARLAELAGRHAEAFELYDELASQLGLAADRREAVRAAAAEQIAREIEAALAAGRADLAAAELERLERAASSRQSTLRLAARVAAAIGDRRAELDALRSLGAAHAGDRALQLRRGTLEIEVGDASEGLALLRAVAAANPGDAATAAALARGRFLYRLANAPEGVRAIAARSELTRADFARLLYWLVPSVRTARPAAVRIATDAFDHPAHDEIVRVANLGLMRIDEALHAFEPNRPLARADAFLALARLRGTDAASRADACRFALAAGWIEAEVACLPAGPVSGPEALEWLHRSGAAESEE